MLINKLKIKSSKYLFLTLLLSAIYIFYIENCFSIGLFDCYGPGCSNDCCNSQIFLPLFPLNVIFIILFVVVDIIFSNIINERGLFIVIYLLMIPIIHFLSLLMIKLIELSIHKIKKQIKNTRK